jgi:hypothetical protein
MIAGQVGSATTAAWKRPVGDEKPESAIEALERAMALYLEEAAKFAALASEAQAKAAEIARFIAGSRHGGTGAPSAPHPPSPPPPPAVPTGPTEPQRLGSTLGELGRRYLKSDNFKVLGHGSRLTYARAINRIIEDCDRHRLSELKATDIRAFYDRWSDNGKKVAGGHGLIRMLRVLIHFGVNTLGDSDCERVSIVLHNLRFRVSKTRNEQMTPEQATAIRAEARKQGRPSIALAQAFQFDCKLNQKEVIGEWVPVDDKGTGIIGEGAGRPIKWISGLLWSEIDEALVLRHKTRRGIQAWSLKNAPMVMEELRQRLGSEAVDCSALPMGGGVIISEATERPYLDSHFRRTWRAIATAAGIPDSVRNSDSRPRNSRHAGEDERQDAEEDRASEGLPL